MRRGPLTGQIGWVPPHQSAMDDRGKWRAHPALPGIHPVGRGFTPPLPARSVPPRRGETPPYPCLVSIGGHPQTSPPLCPGRMNAVPGPTQREETHETHNIQTSHQPSTPRWAESPPYFTAIRVAGRGRVGRGSPRRPTPPTVAPRRGETPPYAHPKPARVPKKCATPPCRRASADLATPMSRSNDRPSGRPTFSPPRVVPGPTQLEETHETHSTRTPRDPAPHRGLRQQRRRLQPSGRRFALHRVRRGRHCGGHRA